METTCNLYNNLKREQSYLIIMDEMDIVTNPFSYTLNIPEDTAPFDINNYSEII